MLFWESPTIALHAWSKKLWFSQNMHLITKHVGNYMLIAIVTYFEHYRKYKHLLFIILKYCDSLEPTGPNKMSFGLNIGGVEVDPGSCSLSVA